MNAEATDLIRDVKLPDPVARLGTSESAWVTLRTSLYPNAKPESVFMVLQYCKARGLDPLKRPVHIVPMRVKLNDGSWGWKDQVLPGIFEYRVTANRTGEYMGHSKPEYGPEMEYLGVKAPDSCSITVYRFNKASGQRCEYPVTVWFSEVVATFYDKDTKSDKVNARWTKAPRQMMTKCAEAAALREAFPDELGGTYSAEEMEGQEMIDITPDRIDPRGPDVENQDWELRDRHCSAIADIINEYGSDEQKMGEVFREYIATRLQGFNELQIAVHDKLAADGIMSKAAWKKVLKS